MNDQQKQLLALLESKLPERKSYLDWLSHAGMVGMDRREIVTGLGERLLADGIPVSRFFVAHRTLHPRFNSFSTTWSANGEVTDDLLPHRLDNERTEDWLKSPLYFILKNQILQHRVKLEVDPIEFPILQKFREAGATDYMVFVRPYASPYSPPYAVSTGEGDGIILSFLTHQIGGFTDEQAELLDQLVTPLAVTLRIANLIESGHTLLSTYLGADAGRRVLSGEVHRGAVRTINAVIWFSDMRGSTRLSEQLEPEAFVEMLNDYHQAGTEAVLAHGGEILKFIGDGLFAIFEIGPNDDAREVCLRAMQAGRQAGVNLRTANDRRRAENLPVGKFDVGIHIGDMLYGNVGAEDRLDFTVIGRSVNYAKRLEELCKVTGDACLVSRDVHKLIESDNILEAVGSYALPGFTGEHPVFRVPLTIVN